MPSKRMTANPVKPSRYRPGKGQEESSSDSESSDNETTNAESTKPPPKASSFPIDSTRIASSLKDVDLNARRAKAAAEESARLAEEKKARELEEAGFETEQSEDDSASEEEDGESSEESSSDDDTPTTLLRPTFIKKAQRANLPSASILSTTTTATTTSTPNDQNHRQAKANAIVQTQLEKNAALRAANKKSWDDDEHIAGPEDDPTTIFSAISDTDDRDPPAERAAWKLREFRRIARARAAIEAAESERAVIEARRALPTAERDAIDRAHVEAQHAARADRASMGYLQKYYHKGAFFRDEAREAGLAERAVVGVKMQDEVANRELLPEYMQIRDMTRLGRKGRTRYKDLKTEDTGRWGGYATGSALSFGGAGAGGNGGSGAQRGGMSGVDERFAPDAGAGAGAGASGANATAIRPRRPAENDRSTGDARKRSTSPAGRAERDKRRRVDVQ